VKIQSAELLCSCPHPRDFPPPDLPEIAFLGRSNVGKSSLLNRLVARKQLARTSSTPGKTRMVHFFRIEAGGAPMLFVDLPGYGYARVSKTERASWKRLVEGYLENRAALRLAILLQDVRRDLRDDETLLLDWLAEREIPALLAVTKIDKLKRMQRAKQLKGIHAQLGEGRDTVVATSSEKGLGMDLLWRAIMERV
jgi:GTP-binding protein